MMTYPIFSINISTMIYQSPHKLGFSFTRSKNKSSCIVLKQKERKKCISIIIPLSTCAKYILFNLYLFVSINLNKAESKLFQH